MVVVPGLQRKCCGHMGSVSHVQPYCHPRGDDDNILGHGKVWSCSLAAEQHLDLRWSFPHLRQTCAYLHPSVEHLYVGALIELSAGLSSLPTCGTITSTASGQCTRIVLHARWEEVGGLEICKMREVGEEETATACDSLADGFVELDDVEVTLSLMLSEHLKDELTILSKFINFKREHESICSFNSSPCSNPVSEGFNRSSKVGSGESEFKPSDFLHLFVGQLGGVMAGQDHIKIDMPFPKDIFKFCKQELWQAGTKVISPDNLLEVFQPVIKEPVGTLKRLR